MSDIQKDMTTAEDFLKKHFPDVSKAKQVKAVAELAHMLWETRLSGKTESNYAARIILGKVAASLIREVSVDELEIMINHSGRGLRLLRDVTTKKKT